MQILSRSWRTQTCACRTAAVRQGHIIQPLSTAPPVSLLNWNQEQWEPFSSATIEANSPIASDLPGQTLLTFNDLGHNNAAWPASPLLFSQGLPHKKQKLLLFYVLPLLKLLISHQPFGYCLYCRILLCRIPTLWAHNFNI